MNDHSPVIFLNNFRQHRKRRRWALISLGEYIDDGAFHPSYIRRRMDRFLDICSVEVERQGLILGEGTTVDGVWQQGSLGRTGTLTGNRVHPTR